MSVGCAATVASGRSATCLSAIRVPHFNASDAIDYETLFARVVSPQANNWRVQATLADAKGVVYFAWYCAAGRSTMTAGNESYVGRTCEATRRMVTSTRNGRTTTTYYTADTSKPQQMTVTSWVGSCVPTSSRGCKFEAAGAYLITR
jgi:hypothetical protein